MAFKPKPIDTRGVSLPADLSELTETLARNTHDHWASKRMAEGWRVGPYRDDRLKTHPNLVPYSSLPDSERDYDRATAMEALKAIVALGYRIERDPRNENGASPGGTPGAEGSS